MIMVKKLLLVAALLTPAFVSAQSYKFGTVDTKAIFDAMPEKVAAENRLNDLSARYHEENKKLESEFNQKYADFQALDPYTPKSIKERRMQEIQENQRKISQFQRMVENDIKTKQAELLDPIKSKIQEAIDSVGVQGGYLFIFDVSKTPVAFKSSEAADVTPEVKSRLGLK